MKIYKNHAANFKHRLISRNKQNDAVNQGIRTLNMYAKTEFVIVLRSNLERHLFTRLSKHFYKFIHQYFGLRLYIFDMNCNCQEITTQNSNTENILYKSIYYKFTEY